MDDKETLTYDEVVKILESSTEIHVTRLKHDDATKEAFWIILEKLKEEL